jgi:hypothetical protein
LPSADVRTVVMNTNEFRTRHAPQPADRSALLQTMAGAAACFIISALAVLYWEKIPAPNQWMPMLTGSAESSNTPSFSGDRVGRSETAPLLKTCVTKKVLAVDPGREIEPGILFQFLVAARAQGRVTAALGAPPQHSAVEVATKWGDVADCVYRADSRDLCDIDNRALAVQAANTFLVQADQIASNPASFAADLGEVGALSQVQSRVLESLKYLAVKGVLIASDFAPFAPTPVRRAFADIKPEQNACAK